METYIVSQILESMSEGELVKAFGFVAIFFLLWVQLKGLRKEMHLINSTISEGFGKVDHRFSKIEDRLTVVENIQEKIHAKGI